VHIHDSSRNTVTRVEVVSHSGAKVHIERQILALGVFHTFRTLGIYEPDPKPGFDVRGYSPVGLDKIVTYTHHIGSISGFRALRNNRIGSAERQITISPEKQRTGYIVKLPSQRQNERSNRII